MASTLYLVAHCFKISAVDEFINLSCIKSSSCVSHSNSKKSYSGALETEITKCDKKEYQVWQNEPQTVTRLWTLMLPLSEFSFRAFTILAKFKAIFMYDCSHLHIVIEK